MTRTSTTTTHPDGPAEGITFEESSGNVFADLGFPNPAEHRQKILLIRRLDALLKERGLTQTQAAELLGIDQPGLSRLLRGVVRGISLEKLMQFLERLDQHVLIVVTPRTRASGVLQVDVAAATADDPSLVVRVAPAAASGAGAAHQGPCSRTSRRPHNERSHRRAAAGGASLAHCPHASGTRCSPSP